MADSETASELNTFFKGLLGLEDPWKVLSVERNEKERSVELKLHHPRGVKVTCRECGELCSKADHTPERTWRHLDTMQYVTILRAPVPRSKCAKCGVHTIEVPWADRFSRMTRMMEDHLIEVLQCAASISAGCDLAGIDWSTAQRIMDRAVERGLKRRDANAPVRLAGMDEKSFGRGHSYVSVLSDLERGAVIEVVPERTLEAATQAWESLPLEAREGIEAIAMDMWPAFQSAAKTAAPQADIIFDRYHISQHLNQAVDQVRRSESKRLRKAGDDTLSATRYLWLTRPENLTEEKAQRLDTLANRKLKTSRAWAIKESFTEFWEHWGPFSARDFFDQWYSWAIRSRLAPVKKVARMLKKHLAGLLTYFTHWITNAASEGLNSRIQALKAAARGFRRFEHYRARILFFCGKLDLFHEPVQP